MKKKRAFTLAEILIALALIGILSSVAIQTMRNRDSNDEYSALQGKSVINIQATMHQALFDKKSAEIFDGNEQELWDDVVKRLDSKGTYIGTIDGDGTSYEFHGMRDGSYFAYHDVKEEGSPILYKIAIDVNGQKQPNKLGKDQVIWYMDKFGGMGTDRKENPCKDEPIKIYYVGGKCQECPTLNEYNVNPDATKPEEVVCCQKNTQHGVKDEGGIYHCCGTEYAYYNDGCQACPEGSHSVPVIDTATGQETGERECCEAVDNNNWYDGGCHVCKPEPFEYFRSGLCCTNPNHIRIDGPDGPYCGSQTPSRCPEDTFTYMHPETGAIYCLCEGLSNGGCDVDKVRLDVPPGLCTYPRPEPIIQPTDYYEIGQNTHGGCMYSGAYECVITLANATKQFLHGSQRFFQPLQYASPYGGGTFQDFVDVAGDGYMRELACAAACNHSGGQYPYDDAKCSGSGAICQFGSYHPEQNLGWPQSFSSAYYDAYANHVIQQVLAWVDEENKKAHDEFPGIVASKCQPNNFEQCCCVGVTCSEIPGPPEDEGCPAGQYEWADGSCHQCKQGYEFFPHTGCTLMNPNPNDGETCTDVHWTCNGEYQLTGTYVCDECEKRSMHCDCCDLYKSYINLTKPGCRL